LTYGDFISHGEIDKNFMPPKPLAIDFASQGRIDEYDRARSEWDFDKLARFEMVRRLVLEDRQMLLVSQRGRGYTICHPSDQVEHAADQFRSAILRETARLDRTAANVNFGAIEDESERQRVLRQSDAAQGLSSFLSGSVRKMKVEFEF
jgi:hypothetical protein